MFIIEDLGNQHGYEKLSPTGATGFTAAKIKPISGVYKGQMAKAVLINIETQPVRVRMDGTDATAANGLLMKADTYYTIINPENIKNFSCIDTAAGASAVHCLFFF
ncbi:hypothetical protein KAU19_08295 [Candidatus Parcubacteria bacterium]|nr:hypothetical protein [Candidatus Parcubacteria bacterium]